MDDDQFINRVESENNFRGVGVMKACDIMVSHVITVGPELDLKAESPLLISCCSRGNLAMTGLRSSRGRVPPLTQLAGIERERGGDVEH
jgi:hypothetical protein